MTILSAAHSTVKWTAREAVLLKFFHLQTEVDIFMTEWDATVPQLQENSYCSDICCVHNDQS